MLESPASAPLQSAFIDRLQAARQGSSVHLDDVMESCRRYANLIVSTRIPRPIRGRIRPSDLAQDACLKATRHISGFRGTTEGQLMKWIRSILFNCLRDALGRAEHRVTRSFDDWDSTPGRVIDPSAAAEAAESAQAVRGALDRLPGRYRRALELRHFEDLSFSEIGASLDCSEEAARKLCGRAQLILGAALKAHR